MPDEKRKPGRPRKWSSDAERMRATRAAKREQQRVEEAPRGKRAGARQEAKRAELAGPGVAVRASNSGQTLEPSNTWMAVHAVCEANIRKLRAEVRRLEDDYDDAVYDRWILEHQYRLAVGRMRDRDPEGLAWLDEQVQRWERRREGFLEDRRRRRRRG